ncbi:MAG: glycine cleavage system aminomethyltransferase GcvT [Dehalococcoidia bacterium]|nr:glycine cleavage system aminomethyltransferase GcvT [Dehalococcoidia bacterium]MDW8120535.1 glycine cleavage system aminomethyltransferase GcvT [Chloroflexota bacterium]
MSPSPPSLLRTALYAEHLAQGAKMVPFAGWEMPLQFAGILAEVRAVRTASGIFDVSHMGRIRVEGPGAGPLLARLLTHDARALRPGRARYGFLLNPQGGIIDDTILYRLGEERYLLVCNAANRLAVGAWLAQWGREFPPLTLTDITLQTVMVAFQGPDAFGKMASLAPVEGLRPFGAWEGTLTLDGNTFPALVGRTGYTGEDGVEVVVPAEGGPALWRRLVALGAQPCGLGARDILRLEAGLMLHGTDIDPSTTPLEAGLERFVDLQREGFIGREALLAQQAQGLRRRLVGFVLHQRGVPRHGYSILYDGKVVGSVTSGGFSPTLEKDIGMGYVEPACAQPATPLEVDIRGRRVPGEVVALPFYSRRRAESR